METAMMRYDEVDGENRSLRAAKYELETKVLAQIPYLLLMTVLLSGPLAEPVHATWIRGACDEA